MNDQVMDFFSSLPAGAHSKMTNVKIHQAQNVKEWFNEHIKKTFFRMDWSP